MGKGKKMTMSDLVDVLTSEFDKMTPQEEAVQLSRSQAWLSRHPMPENGIPEDHYRATETAVRILQSRGAHLVR